MPKPVEAFYVAIRSGARLTLAYGPVDTMGAADAAVDAVRAAAETVDPMAWGYGYETARVVPRPGQVLPPGRLNDRVNARLAA